VENFAPFGVTICGIDDLAGHRGTGASHVLSILDPAWPVPEAFGTYGEHARLELRFHDVIDESPGVIAPSAEHVGQILAFGRELMAEAGGGAHLLVHCHAGVSRSTASMALILAQALPDVPPAAIFQHILRTRPPAWPNLRILEFGDALLSRRGAIVAAVAELYRAQLRRRPELAGDMETGGRAREVAAALA
jgi:predicted protein tyrosine phosphatase